MSRRAAMPLVLLLRIIIFSNFFSKRGSHRRRLIMPTTEANIPKTKCPLCGEPLQNPNECSKCDWVTGYRQSPEAGLIKPRDLVAAFLSLAVPGLGHVYKGQTKTG